MPTRSMKPSRKAATSEIDVTSLAGGIEDALRSGGTLARKTATLGYFPSALENLGVGAKHLRSVVRDAKRLLKGEEPAVAVRLAREIVGRGAIESRQAAYEILLGHPGAIDALGIREVEALGRGMDNWVSVDGFSCFVAGQAWRRGRIHDAHIMKWARSKDRWWRRAAVVATVPLNARSRGGEGDSRRTLMVVEAVVTDRDPMVAKAVSWALRELIRTDRKAVERFLREHDAELPALVTREVGNKLRTGKKNPKR